MLFMKLWSISRLIDTKDVSGQTSYFRENAAKISDKFRDNYYNYEIDGWN